MLARDPYATLGVPPTASGEDIEEAYRHLSRRYHPDINPGNPHAAAVFARIEEAHRVLADAELRARYDREGSLARTPHARGLGLNVRVLPDADDRSSFADLFRRLRDHARRSRPARGEDLHLVVDVPLAQAERGRRVGLAVRRRSPCPHCGGRGRVQLQKTRPCERCNGVGEETFVKGALAVSCPCAGCSGEGVIAGADCERCRGSGLATVNEKVLVRVPPGASDGQEVRVPGAGHAGPGGGPPGDLVARVRLERVPGFERLGPHLRTVLPVGLADAVCGARIEVRTLDGDTASLRVPPLTQNGRELRLRSRGLELPDGRRGDMLVRVEIRIPDIVDEDAKRLLRQLGSRQPARPAGAPVESES